MTLFASPRCFICGELPQTSLPPVDGLCGACRARLFRGDDEPPAGLCMLCGQFLLGEIRFCADCCRAQWSFSRIEGLVPYQSPAGELLRTYKMRRQTALAEFWARQALARLTPRAPLVPVPPHPKHLRERGWDPVAQLCARLSRLAGVPVWKALRRKATASQKSLGREERQTNAARSYELRTAFRRRLTGVPLVWLVDDVVTTGATAQACSRELLAAGVGEVRVLCLCLH